LWKLLKAPPRLIVSSPANHHQAFLRPHLDEPLHDGFGVVIVTLAVSGNATILLQSRPWDVEARRDYHFPLRAGHAYVLCGDVRNLALHGVLSDGGSERRESLNLRFGIHASEAGGAFSAWEEVERHWPQPAGA